MIDLVRLKTFLCVAKYGGFRQAAQHAGLSQSAVTQHVKYLEQLLQTVLFDRSNVRCTLTVQGEAFVPYAEHLIRTAESASNLFRKQSLIIGASSNIGIYLLPSYLKAFQDQFSIETDLVIDRNAVIAEKLENYEIDLAVMEWWDNRPGFHARVWRSEELVLIVPPNHLWAKEKSIQRYQLVGVELLGGEVGTGTRRILEQYLGDDATSLRISMQLGSTEAVKRAVSAGLGVSLVLAE